MKIFKKELIVLFLAGFGVLAPLLAPGYVLTLDMVWVPELGFSWSDEKLNNAAPIHILLTILGTIFPSWFVQKLMLVTLVGLILYLPYRFLPLIQDSWMRVFAALLYLLNPFVYVRLLAGQWTVLLGYALLPLVLYALIKLLKQPDKRSAGLFAGSLILVGMVSVHYLYLSFILSAIVSVVYTAWLFFAKDTTKGWQLIQMGVLATGLFTLISSYWIVPALLREAPLEQRFDQSHFEVFAASVNTDLSVYLNTVVLGGFWGEGSIWRYYFLWPQEQVVFWLGAGVVGLLILYGWWGLWRARAKLALALLFGGAILYILSLGAGENIFHPFNIWLYQDLPGWGGLRDSHKVVGVLALLYVFLAGLGAERLMTLKKIADKRFMFLPILFTLPLITGLYMWNGFFGQIDPTWYPDSWNEARSIATDLSPSDKVLVLPWRGYFSLPFAEQRIVANPTPRFFGEENVLAGKSVEAGMVRDQEESEEYREIDNFFIREVPPNEDEILAFLKENNIRYLFAIENPSADPETWWIPRTSTGEPVDPEKQSTNILEWFASIPHETLIEDDVVFYRFDH